jgi:peptidoglycan/LPS O-acetylase OafA/YrhL
MYVVNWPIAYWTQPYLADLVAGRAVGARLSIEALYVVGTSAASFLLALGSWHLIEKHALAAKKRFATRTCVART